MTETHSIHGHAILHLVHESSRPFTRDGLRAEVLRLYGREARFCTCSTSEMSFDELLVFLLLRGKLVERGGLIAADISQLCSGEDHHDED
ncbi:MAG: YecH family metal-binding protein [Tepidisphaeraceae bacterium]|jgi:probable metal-binding protein